MPTFAPSTDTQVLSALRTKLAALHDVQARVTESTNLVNELQKRWDDFEDTLAAQQQMEEDDVDDDLDDERRELRDRLLGALDSLQEQSEQEKRFATHTPVMFGKRY